MRNFITDLYNKKISAIGLAIFRISFCLVLLAEIVQFYYFRHLIFDKVPYLDQAEIDFGIPIILWAISVFFIIIGLFTRFATIVNYLLSLILIGSIQTYEYHMFYAYMGISFLMIFLPISKVLSLDRLLLKYKYSNTRFNYKPPTTVSVLSYYVPVLVGIAFVYFDSIFFKFSSDFWRNGLGMWLPSSVPQTLMFPLQDVLNLKYVMLAFGYLTLVFETVFLFTFFRKKWRVPLLIIGLGLHLGILISYPIPWFALGMCSIYLLMVPVSWWKKIGDFFILQQPKQLFYYDNECPLCNRTKITIEHFDIQKSILFKTVQFDSENQPLLESFSKDELLDNIYSVKNNKVYKGIDTYIQVLDSIFYTKPLSWILRLPGIYHIGKLVYNYIAQNRNTERCTEENCGYTPPIIPEEDNKIKILHSYTLEDLKINILTIGLVILIVLQVIVSYNSPLNKIIRDKIGFEKTTVNNSIEKFSSSVESKTKTLFGITGHGVFMDYHFSEYNHIIAVTYTDNLGKETWLPIIKQDGTPGNYLYGPIWAKWSFRVNHNKINQSNLEKGIRDFAAFWAKKNNINLDNAKFIIKVKKIETPTHWEKDFLKRQMEKPWQNIGKAFWKDKQYFIEIPIIEDL